MQTECTAGALEFQTAGGRAVVARFDGGTLTSDGGAVLLREVERVTGVLGRFAGCFTDHRDPARVTHAAGDLTAPLAGKSTLNRLELSAATVGGTERYKKTPLVAHRRERAPASRDGGTWARQAPKNPRH